MKKICFIGPKAYQLFNPEIKSTFGGAEIQLWLLAKELAKDKELKISFMVADYGQKEIEKNGRIIIWKSLNFKKNKLNQVLAFYKTFKKINAETYIQRTLSPFSGIIAFYCKIKNKKLVYMLANDGEADYTNPIFKNPLSAVLAKYALKNSEIIVQNNYQKERLLEKGIKSIIFTNKFNINKNNIKKKRYILWVGRLDENYKRPELFVELSKEFPKEKFIMIAPEATNQETYRKKIIKSLSKNIRLIDFVEFNKIQSYFNRAKIFVNTSSQEGFPNTFIQSGIGKTPIISLKVDPDNFIKKNNCGYICNDNPNLMKKSLEKLLKNKNDWKIKSKNLYNYVKKNHNIKNSKIAEIIK